jgi:multidrug transporter EmrE-like cation transporter
MRNPLLLAGYFLFVTAANALLKLSADASTAAPFLLFQAAGNVAGFVGVLAYTGLMRTLPLHVAFPLTQGFAVLGVQLLASLLIFREAFTPREAAGSILVAAGILLVGAAAPRRGTQRGGGPRVEAAP